jgi:NAD(P)H-hydrate epimerase
MAAIDRSAQADYSIPSIVLMENAGARALETLRGAGLREPVVFVAGRGNNGGDALVMARHARVGGLKRLAVVVAGGAPRAGSEPAVNLDTCRALGIEILPFDDRRARSRIQEAAWIVDGLCGTGLAGPLRPPLDRVVAALNKAGASKAAVDVPSGLRDGWTPPEPVARADVTLTMGLPKRCLYLPLARTFCGKILVVDAGFPPALLESEALRGELLEAEALPRLVPALEPDTYKNRRGHLAVLAGSPGTTGAAWLASHAAARSRAGLVTLYAHPDTYAAVAGSYRSVMVRGGAPARGDLDRYDAFVAGPGWGVAPERRAQLLLLLRSRLPGVLDADALALAADIVERDGIAPGPTRVMTPHPGEAARLLGRPAAEILADPLAALEQAGRRFGCVIVLKGHVTTVWSPDGRFALLDGMNAALATGGSGDVLAGTIAGLLASGVRAEAAARAGVLAHALAASRAVEAGGLPLAEDLLPFLSQVFGYCVKEPAP